MAGSRRASVRAEGLDEVVRALQRLPLDAEREMRTSAQGLSERLAQLTQAAGKGSGRQAARAAGTVRAGGGLTQAVVAGPHPLLFGSEFGANGHYGWYGARRYSASRGRQFPRSLGGGSYWFFRTAEGAPQIAEQWRRLADAIIAGWGA